MKLVNIKNLCKKFKKKLPNEFLLKLKKNYLAKNLPK
jgi:hypothetical protein